MADESAAIVAKKSSGGKERPWSTTKERTKKAGGAGRAGYSEIDEQGCGEVCPMCSKGCSLFHGMDRTGTDRTHTLKHGPDK